MEIVCQQEAYTRSFKIELHDNNVPLAICEIEVYGGNKNAKTKKNNMFYDISGPASPIQLPFISHFDHLSVLPMALRTCLRDHS